MTANFAPLNNLARLLAGLPEQLILYYAYRLKSGTIVDKMQHLNAEGRPVSAVGLKAVVFPLRVCLCNANWQPVWVDDPRQGGKAGLLQSSLGR